MKNVAEKLVQVEQRISKQKGDFNLFGLFLREDQQKWDVLVSASWIGKNEMEAIRTITAQIQEELNDTELSQISRIVVIDEGNPDLYAITEHFETEHEVQEIKDYLFSDIEINKAYLITSKLREPVSSD